MIGHFDKDEPFVQETTKIAEIRDNFGKLRFKVVLIDMFDYYEETCCDQRYRISVESFCYGMQPMTILSEYRSTFHAAYEFYRKSIENYKNLVLAETKDFQDIKIYADREHIKYHIIEPECCANCKWSCEYNYGEHGCHDDMHTNFRKRHRLQCMNRNMFVMPGRRFFDVQPEVAPNGICKQYCDRRKGRN